MCEDLILDQCPDPYMYRIASIEYSNLKDCMRLCDEPVYPECRSFIYTITSNVCQLFTCTVGSYMDHCATFGGGDDTVGDCVTDDIKYPDHCKNVIEGGCKLSELNVIKKLYGVKYEDECFAESQYWGGVYFVMRNDTEACRIYNSNERQCKYVRGPNGSSDCELPIKLYDV